MIRSMLAPLAAFALASCFVQPGAFESALILNRDGTFDYSYSGEVVAVNAAMQEELDRPSGDANADFDATLATCTGFKGDRYVSVAGADNDPIRDSILGASLETVETIPPGPCTAEEIAGERERRRDVARSQAVQREQQRSAVARLGGLGDGTEQSYRDVARRLNEQRGWSDVVYQGRGVFTGRYHATGRVDAGFVFPLLPTTETITPFVRLVPLNGGRVRVDAPGLTTATSLLDQLGKMSALMKMDLAPNPPLDTGSQPRGTFTLTTDAAILTNNTLNGPTTTGGKRRLSWTVGGLQQAIPEALLRL